MNRIKEKIQKLLDLSGNNPNANEAESALLKAQELMARHKIEMNDLGVKSTVEIVSMISTEPSRSTWKRGLADIISDNFKCMSYLQNYGRGRLHYVFFGDRSDVEVAYDLYEYAVKWLNNSACNYATNQRVKYGIVKGVKQDYILGFLKGLKDKFKEQLSNHVEMALVMVVTQEVKDSYTKMSETFKSMKLSNSINTHGSHEAREAGYLAGKTFGNKQVQGGEA